MAEPTHGWRHPGLMLLYAFVAVFLAMMLASAVVVATRPLHGPWFDLLRAALVALAFITVYVAFCRWVERRRAAELSSRGAAIELVAGLAIGFALMSAIVAIIAAFGGYRVTGTRDFGVLLPALTLAIASSVSEEIMFRGLFFRLVERWRGSGIALAASAALFGALHLFNTHATALAGIAIALEAGIMLAALFMLTRRLWAAIGVHAAWNFAQGGIYGIPVSGGAMDGVLRADIRGPDLLTGGAFGAEASLPAIIVATGFGTILLIIARRRGRFMAPGISPPACRNRPASRCSSAATCS